MGELTQKEKLFLLNHLIISTTGPTCNRFSIFRFEIPPRCSHLSPGWCSCWAACCCGRADTSRRPSPRTTRWWCAASSGPPASGCWTPAQRRLWTRRRAPSGLSGHMTIPGCPPRPGHSPPGRPSRWTQSLRARRRQSGLREIFNYNLIYRWITGITFYSSCHLSRKHIKYSLVLLLKCEGLLLSICMVQWYHCRLNSTCRLNFLLDIWGCWKVAAC